MGSQAEYTGVCTHGSHEGYIELTSEYLATHNDRWAVPAMQWANGVGLIQGSDNNLMPKGNATRAQAAAILHRFCETVTGE